MPFKNANSLFRDIAQAVESIEQFTAGMDFHAFAGDAKTIAAVERKLLIISEAAIRLGADAEILCPGMPRREIRGIGNWLRHQYDRIELPVLWNTLNDDLPALKTAVLDAFQKGQPGSSDPDTLQ